MRLNLLCFALLLFVPFFTGCSGRFELTRTTRIDGDDRDLSSWQAQLLVDAQKRLAKELTQRTGWQWEVSAAFFRPSEAPPNTIFFRKNSKLTGDTFRIQVTRKSVVVEAASTEDFDKAVNALLDALVQEDGRFFLAVGTMAMTPES